MQTSAEFLGKCIEKRLKEIQEEKIMSEQKTELETIGQKLDQIIDMEIAFKARADKIDKQNKKLTKRRRMDMLITYATLALLVGFVGGAAVGRIIQLLF